MYKILILLLWGTFFSQSSIAKTNSSIESVIKSSFLNVTSINPKQLVLNKVKYENIKNKAKAAIRTRVYRYYDIKSGSKIVGYGVLVTRKVRTKKATVLYAFGPKGDLKFSEIMAFSEPPEYIPNKKWMSQFKNQSPSSKLTVGKDIPTISGSTLSARSISDGARIARAIYQVAIKR